MTSTTEQEIFQEEQQLVRAKRNLDLATLDRLYANDLLLTGVLGEPTCTKAAILDEIKRGIHEREQALASGRPVEVSAENEDMNVAAHGDTVITNYRFVVKSKGPGIDVQHRYRTTNVWMKRDGGWQIVAAHVAFILEPRQAALLSAGTPP